jgi:hypothetical protein
LDFSVDLIFPAAMWLGLTQPLTEMITRNLPVSKWRLTTSPPSVSRLFLDVGASTSHNPIGIHALLQGYLYPLFMVIKKI